MSVIEIFVLGTVPGGLWDEGTGKISSYFLFLWGSFAKWKKEQTKKDNREIRSGLVVYIVLASIPGFARENRQ